MFITLTSPHGDTKLVNVNQIHEITTEGSGSIIHTSKLTIAVKEGQNEILELIKQSFKGE